MVSCGPDCNNSVIDVYEECDGGNGCSDCRCKFFYSSTNPISLDCSAALVPTIISSVVLVVVLLGSTLFAVKLYRLRRKYKYKAMKWKHSDICKHAWLTNDFLPLRRRRKIQYK